MEVSSIKHSRSIFQRNFANFIIVDSLQAIEIRNRALINMKSELSVFDIMSTKPLAELAAQIAAKSELVKITASED
jgi:hypothetical protein